MSALDRALSVSGRTKSMKLLINTTGVSFTCARAPEQPVSFDTGQPRVDKATGVPLH
jgi:hypothetical protein